MAVRTALLTCLEGDCPVACQISMSNPGAQSAPRGQEWGVPLGITGALSVRVSLAVGHRQRVPGSPVRVVLSLEPCPGPTLGWAGSAPLYPHGTPPPL